MKSNSSRKMPRKVKFSLAVCIAVSVFVIASFFLPSNIIATSLTALLAGVAAFCA